MRDGPNQKSHIKFTLNGETAEVAFAPHKTLLEVLREDLALTGTKHGCELGECGTCTVLVDGAPVLSTSTDRKSTRLNSSHPSISYAVFCLKKKKHVNPTKRPKHELAF